jgi:[NiFe] hydrogenase assembly HybE family chaperone
MSFEGSYMGAADRISPRAVMECKVCWWVYDPAEGDAYRQILPGTAFADLPDDWSCPHCGTPAAQFMVQSDPGSTAAAEDAALAAAVAALEADFREVHSAKMRGLPMVNTALHVEAVGFCAHEGQWLGVLIAPWFMNLVLLPDPGADWSGLVPGEKEVVGFPSGDYEFLHNRREMTGGYKACSLFSPMADFTSQLQAQEVARAVMVALFDSANRAETDRAAEIRAAREAELAPPPEADAMADPAPSRRAVLTGGLAGG